MWYCRCPNHDPRSISCVYFLPSCLLPRTHVREMKQLTWASLLHNYLTIYLGKSTS